MGFQIKPVCSNSRVKEAIRHEKTSFKKQMHPPEKIENNSDRINIKPASAGIEKTTNENQPPEYFKKYLDKDIKIKNNKGFKKQQACLSTCS